MKKMQELNALLVFENCFEKVEKPNEKHKQVVLVKSEVDLLSQFLLPFNKLELVDQGKARKNQANSCDVS